MPHSSPSYVITVIQHYAPFLRFNPYFFDKAISQATIKRWFKKLKDKASDAQSKSLQRRARLEVVDELVEIVDSCPYFGSKYLA